MFRSVLYTEYEELGAPAAIILTAFVSSFFDMSAVAFIPSFAGGLILGFSVYVTQSVFAPLVIHILYNLYALFFEEYIWAFIAKPENEIFFTFVLITAMLFCGIMMLSQAERVIYDKGIREEALPEYLREYTEKRGKLPSTAKGLIVSLLSPGYLACVVLFVLRVTGII